MGNATGPRIKRYGIEGSKGLARNPADVVTGELDNDHDDPALIDVAQAAVAAQHGEQNPDATCVYSMYNLDDELLYIGISGSPRSRFSKHILDKHWITEVATVTYDWYPTRVEAEVVEAESIRELEPRYNVQHNSDPLVAAFKLLGVLAEDHSDSPRCGDCGYRVVKHSGKCATCHRRGAT